MMPGFEFSTWDTMPWATLFGIGAWVSRSMAQDDRAAGRHVGAVVGRLLAFGCAVAGCLVLSVGLAWGTERLSFGFLGWMGMVALVWGTVDTIRVREGNRPILRQLLGSR